MKLPRDVRLVSYHGSITAHHGPGWMVAECACSRFYPGRDERSLRAVLVTRSGEPLMHVRRESFTYL